jgi:HD-GYP domain-containing protein (c-di-GMP phosphodiesterase class II)
MSLADALDELRRHAGSQFDCRCVDALAEHLAAEAMS